MKDQVAGQSNIKHNKMDVDDNKLSHINKIEIVQDVIYEIETASFIKQLTFLNTILHRKTVRNKENKHNTKVCRKLVFARVFSNNSLIENH